LVSKQTGSEAQAQRQEEGTKWPHASCEPNPRARSRAPGRASREKSGQGRRACLWLCRGGGCEVGREVGKKGESVLRVLFAKVNPDF